MKKKFKTLANKLPKEERVRLRAELKTKEMMAEMLLSEIRKDAGLTQQDLAKALNMKQPSLSKLESQDDMQISTLRKIIEGLGGKLEMIAHLPKGDLRIGQFAS